MKARKEDLVPFTTLWEKITTSQEYGSNMANAVIFKREAGSAPVQINGYPLDEGETLSIAGNFLEADQTRYIVAFDPTSLAPKGLWMISKVYLY